MKTPVLLLPREYVARAVTCIDNAKHSITMVCLIMTEDHSTDDIIDALVRAAKRGVDVQVAADVFTYGEFSGHFRPFKYYSKPSLAATAMSKRLRNAGVRFTCLGKFSLLPIFGRTHSKITIVDDTVFSFGGVNLDNASLDFADYMFEYKNAALAAQLTDDARRLIDADDDNFAYKSHSYDYPSVGRVLVDGGFQGDSIIYRRACQLAREATDITFVSQYCPTGKLSRILRKKQAKLYFNRVENTNNRLNSLFIRMSVWFNRFKTLYTNTQYLHAKFILFTMPDGQKIALTGSHNFIYTGVIMGTREIALETDHPAIIKQLESFFQKYVA